MILFSFKTSTICPLFAALFVAAFLADSANLDDLIPGTIVVHSDDDNAVETDSNLLENAPLCQPVQSHALPLQHSANEERRAKSPVRIIYDQDSGSLAARQTATSESPIALLSEIQSRIHSAHAVQTLYLLHCSFLI